MAALPVTLMLATGPSVADPSRYGTWRNAFPTKAADLLSLRNLEQMKRMPNQDVDMQIVPGPSTGESGVVI